MLRTLRSPCLFLLACALTLFALSSKARAQSEIVGWGLQVFDSRWNKESFAEIAAGALHTLARRSDGSVVAWGDNEYGQCRVPALPPGLSYVEVAAGTVHSVARRSDGSVVAWGNNYHGQSNVTAHPPGSTYIGIAAGNGQNELNGPNPGGHTIAQRSDGSLVGWGVNSYGQCNAPALPTGFAFLEIGAGPYRTVARVGPIGPTTVYCRSKTTSTGCKPAIGFSGTPSASGGGAFLITASQVEAQEFGIFFYGTSGKQAAPFQGGTLCVKIPFVRTGRQHSGGGAPCSGSYGIDFNAYVASGKDPSLIAGTTVDGQYWFLDPGFAPPNDSGLTDAIEFTLAP